MNNNTTHTTARGTIGMLTGWSLTLTEPLLSLAHRSSLDHDLATVHTTNPPVAHLFLAGLCSDLAQTLPGRDPWRTLSGRFGGVTVGTNPPTCDGAVLLDGAPFGSWHHTADLTPLVYASPFDDPALAALAGDDLTPAAAAVVAAAGHGWRATFDMLNEVLRVGRPADPSLATVTDIATGEASQRGSRMHYSRDAATRAIRWVAHRRRGYVGPDDPWIAESAFRWAWRVTHSSGSIRWTDAQVTNAIAAWKVHQLAPQDRPDTGD